jgi:trehalose synthase
MHNIRLSDYAPFVDKGVIEEIRTLSAHLKGKTVQMVNSTARGGGVAEILNRMVPLLNDVNIEAKWTVIEAEKGYFEVTKKLHNALHGKRQKFSRHDFNYFIAIGNKLLNSTEIFGDIVFIHDPQPIMLVEAHRQHPGAWFWRCHVDVSRPQLKRFVERYDGVVFSSPNFARRLRTPQFLISPSIDPLSDKNKELPPGYIKAIFDKYGIPRDCPIVMQLSRYDYLKDPLGVIDAFRLARKYIKCRLVLAGNTSVDDPESAEVLARVRQKAGGDPEIHVLALPNDIDTEINALQRGADIILQKSIREGFALTVTEALWKAKPVVASYVGGIPLQIRHKYSGLLSNTIEGTALYLKQLLNNPAYAKKLGENAREHVRNNFLLTRHLRDYIMLFLSFQHPGDIVYL